MSDTPSSATNDAAYTPSASGAGGSANSGEGRPVQFASTDGGHASEMNVAGLHPAGTSVAAGVLVGGAAAVVVGGSVVTAVVVGSVVDSTVGAVVADVGGVVPSSES